MVEKDLVKKYLECVGELEKFFLDRNKEIEEYISVWKNLEKGDEIEQLRFIFNNEPSKMIKYLSVIDCINDILISRAVEDKELSSANKHENEKFLKNYIEMFAGYGIKEYLNDEELSEDCKELAHIYFNLKEIEGDLYSWLKKTQRRVKFMDLTKEGIYI